MDHRALQIIDAVAVNIGASANLSAKVFKHRIETLSEAEQEVPAVIVDMLDDDSISDFGASNVSFLDSLLTVTCTAVAAASNESDLISALVEMRKQIHIALMVDRAQGLAFVIDTRYRGATKPELSIDTDRLVGRLVTRWVVHYRMNITDPS